MAMTLRLSDEEHDALRRRAEVEGASLQDVARRAIRSYVDLEDHRGRVLAAAQKVITVHGEALDRLGR